MTGLVKFEFKLPAHVKKQGNLYIACCPLLDVYSQGDSKKEALANLKEALVLFVESCFERGTLDQVLRSSGFYPAEGKEPKFAADDYVSVPMSLISRKHAEARAH